MTAGLPRAVAHADITCTAVPWQAYGSLWDGPRFYMRVRGGRASLGFGATHDEAVTDATFGDRWLDGAEQQMFYPTDGEAWALFDRLLAQHSIRRARLVTSPDMPCNVAVCAKGRTPATCPVAEALQDSPSDSTGRQAP